MIENYIFQLMIELIEENYGFQIEHYDEQIFLKILILLDEVIYYLLLS